MRLAMTLGVALIVLCSSIGLAKPTPSKQSPQWGPQDQSGLKMGAWKNPQTPELYCIIRNDGQKAVCYNDWGLGYWEAIKIWGRSKADPTWKIIPIKSNQLMLATGIGPGPDQDHMLQSGEILTKNPGTYERMRQISFSIPLYRYAWPDSRDPIEIKIEQSLMTYDPKISWEGTLTSGSFTIIPPKQN